MLFSSTPLVGPHFLQSSRTPSLSSTTWSLHSSTPFQDHSPTYQVGELLLSTFSVPGKPFSHLLCLTSLTPSQTKFCGSRSQHSFMLPALWFTCLLPHSSLKPSLWLSHVYLSKLGIPQRKGFIFTSPSHLPWFLTHGKHPNICWKITFQWIFSKWANHHPSNERTLQVIIVLSWVFFEDTRHAHISWPTLASPQVTLRPPVSHFNFSWKTASRFWQDISIL